MRKETARKTEAGRKAPQYRGSVRFAAALCAASLLPGICFSASAAFADTVLPAEARMRQITARTVAGADGFPDVGSGHWAYDAVRKAGILSGYPDGYFRPSQKVTYGEFFKMICTEKVSEASAGENQEHWAVPYYEAAKSAGYFNNRRIEKGYLGLPMTREHTAHITAGILRAEGWDSRGTFSGSVSGEGGDENGNGSGWSDIGKGFLYADDAELVRAAGILRGYPDGRFGPLQALTRAEAARVICGIAALREKSALTSALTSEERKEQENGSDREQEVGTETGQAIIRRVKKKDWILPVRYNIREVSANDLGILRIEITGERTVQIESSVRYPFIKMMREDGSLRKSVVFPGGACLEKEGRYFYAADPDGENLEGSIPYLLLEDESRTVYRLTDLQVTRAETTSATVHRGNRA